MLGAAAMVGGIAAAYTGALPGPIQKVAHITINAPAPPPPAARQSAVKPRKHGHTSPTPVPASQPATPKRPAPSSAPGPVEMPRLGGTTAPPADPICGPGPWQPQGLPPHYSGPSVPAQLHCPATATPTPGPKTSPSPSASAKATAPATKTPGKSRQAPTS